MSEKGKLNKYKARVEFRASQERIDEMLRQGLAMKDVWKAGIEGGWLSMALTTFYDYVRGQGSRRHGRKNAQKVTPASRPGGVGNQTVGVRDGRDKPDKGLPDKSSPFVHNPNFDLKDLGPGK